MAGKFGFERAPSCSLGLVLVSGCHRSAGWDQQPLAAFRTRQSIALGYRPLPWDDLAH